jgi:adenylate cyclase
MLHIRVANKAGRRTYDHESGPLELGRGPRRESPRLALDDPEVSNNQFVVEEVDGGKVRLENLSTRVEARLADGSALAAGAVRVCDLPVRITAGSTLIEIEVGGAATEANAAEFRTIDRPVRTLASSEQGAFSPLPEDPTPEQLARCLESLVTVQRSAASSPDFYTQTARAVVELIGLDFGMVLLRHGSEWEVKARHGRNPTPGAEFSRTLLDRVCEDRRTFYQVLDRVPANRSQLGGSTVVAAPVLGADGAVVVGAVYGVRAPRTGDATIRPLEAELVQILAASVGTGLARLESEDKAARRHRQFTDFFSPELAAELDRNPTMLDGERRELTILFSDIRGFSRISERLSPEDTCALVRDVMERLTVRIREHQGVVVDYIGDAILALWNAPADQPDHALLACRAALAMQEELPALNNRWADRIGGPFGLGIGLNTGEALVGNTGSRSRFKYGPLGHAVNLASRVEGATKQMGVSALITGATHAALGDHDLSTRRLCRVAVVGIDHPVDLYELHSSRLDPAWRAWRDTYEEGLRHFEAAEMPQACRAFQRLLEGQKGHYDLPTLVLISRAIEHLKDPTRPFNPVLKLDTK